MALGVTPQEIVDKGNYPLLVKANNWSRVLLKDVATVQNGFAFKSSFFDREKGVPLIRIRDITKGKTEHRYYGDFDKSYIVKKGDILIGMDGDFTAARWLGEDALLNQRVCRIKVNSKDFDKKFLFLCLQPYLDAINAETSSVTVKHLSSRTIEDIPLPYPALDVQQMIVAKIEELFSELDNGLTALKTARDQLKVYRQALLKHAFEGKLTEQWRKENKDKLETPEQLLARIQKEREERYQQKLADWKKAVKEWEANGKEGKKPGKPNKLQSASFLQDEELDLLPKLPVGWCWLKVGCLCDVVRGGSPRPAGDARYYGGDIPFLKVADLTRTDGCYVNSYTYTIKPAGLKNTRLVGRNTLLISNSGATLGVPKISLIDATFNDGIAAFLGLSNDELLYHYYFWSSKTAELRAIDQGAAQPNLNTDLIKDVAISVCSSNEMVEVSKEIEKSLSICDQFIAEIDGALKKSETLRQSILKKAFSGELITEIRTLK